MSEGTVAVYEGKKPAKPAKVEKGEKGGKASLFDLEEEEGGEGCLPFFLFFLARGFSLCLGGERLCYVAGWMAVSDSRPYLFFPSSIFFPYSSDAYCVSLLFFATTFPFFVGVHTVHTCFPLKASSSRQPSAMSVSSDG